MATAALTHLRTYDGPKVTLDAVGIDNRQLNVVANPETGTFVEWIIFWKQRAHGVIAWQLIVFAIEVKRLNHLAIEFAFELVFAACIARQGLSCFGVRVVQRGVRFRNLVEPHAGGQVQAQAQVDNGASHIGFLYFIFRIAALRPFQPALRVVFPEIDAVTKPLILAVRFLEMGRFARDDFINERFFSAVKTEYE